MFVFFFSVRKKGEANRTQQQSIKEQSLERGTDSYSLSPAQQLGFNGFIGKRAYKLERDQTSDQAFNINVNKTIINISYEAINRCQAILRGKKKNGNLAKKKTLLCTALLSPIAFQGMALIIVPDLLIDVLSLAFTVEYYFCWE